MEEDEYKSTYKNLTTVRCVFEKVLTNNLAECSLSRHFCLADREGYSCEDGAASAKCSETLAELRKNSSFVLRLHEISGPLPHNMEIRVQAGGLYGLSRLLDESALRQDDAPPTIADINKLLQQVIGKYGELDELPYNEVIKSVLQFKVRRRRQKR